MSRKNALIIGANGYIGLAVCKAFLRAGWQVFGMVRRKQSMKILQTEEVIPLLAALPDLDFLDHLFRHTETFDCIINCSEPEAYAKYFTDVLPMIRRVAETSNRHGVRPLVLWSSGSKDYGNTGFHGESGLSPHTESSPLNSHQFVIPRCQYSLKIFEHTDLFDAAVLRPTNVHGYSSSYLGIIFRFAAAVSARGSDSLRLEVNPNSIMHSLHVDDCAEAYLGLAEHPDRVSVAGHCFNISAHKYETAETILNGVAKEYGLPNGAIFPSKVEDSEAMMEMEWMVKLLFGLSQWVDSGKIRTLTGWTNKRALFSENLKVYRRAYEAAVESQHEDIIRIKGREQAFLSVAADMDGNQ